MGGDPLRFSDERSVSLACSLSKKIEEAICNWRRMNGQKLITFLYAYIDVVGR